MVAVETAARMWDGAGVTLSLRAEDSGDGTVLITAEGMVEYHSAQQIPGAVHAAIVRWSPRLVLIDVAGVRLMDAAGLGALLAGRKAAASVSVIVAVLNPSDTLYRQMQAADVADQLCPHLAVLADDELMPATS
jgi:anti-sigma B factor antagonist